MTSAGRSSVGAGQRRRKHQYAEHGTDGSRLPTAPTHSPRSSRSLPHLTIEDAQVELIEVADEAEAVQRGMHGSPTILIDGTDPFASPAAVPNLSCRLYRSADGLASRLPGEADLRRALIKGPSLDEDTGCRTAAHPPTARNRGRPGLPKSSPRGIHPDRPPTQYRTPPSTYGLRQHGADWASSDGSSPTACCDGSPTSPPAGFARPMHDMGWSRRVAAGPSSAAFGRTDLPIGVGLGAVVSVAQSQDDRGECGGQG